MIGDIIRNVGPFINEIFSDLLLIRFSIFC